jgi:DNA-binding transcriptional LysR family regulator
LGVQESAISRRIRDLEERLGAALFVRSHSGVQLTFAGKQFVERGRKALSDPHLHVRHHLAATVIFWL